VTEAAGLTEGPAEEVAGSPIAVQTGKEGGIVWERAVETVIVGAIETSHIGVPARPADSLCRHVFNHADTLARNELPEHIGVTFLAAGRGGTVALVTVVRTRIAGKIHSILNSVSSTEGLAEASCQVEVQKWRITLPSHHVQHRGHTQTKSAGIGESPREEYVDSILSDPTNSLRGIFPLILKPTIGLGNFE
jgi:hypothetical protein